MARHRRRNRRDRRGQEQAYGNGRKEVDRDGDIQICDNPFGIRKVQVRRVANHQQYRDPQHPTSRRQQRSNSKKQPAESYEPPNFIPKSDSSETGDRGGRGKDNSQHRAGRSGSGPFPWPPSLNQSFAAHGQLLDASFFRDCKQVMDDLYTTSLRVLSLWAQYRGVPWRADNFGAEEMEWEPCAATKVVYVRQPESCSDIDSDGESAQSDGGRTASICPEAARRKEGPAMLITVQDQGFMGGMSAELRQHQASEAAPAEDSWRSWTDWRNSSHDAGSYYPVVDGE